MMRDLIPQIVIMLLLAFDEYAHLRNRNIAAAIWILVIFLMLVLGRFFDGVPAVFRG